MTSAAPRYATALFNEAKAQKILAKVAMDVESTEVAIRTVENLEAILAHPLTDKEVKCLCVSQLAINLKFQQLTKDFLQLVVQNGRANMLCEICKAFDKLVAAENGEVTVKVTAAEKLTAAQIKALEAFAKTQLKGAKKIKLEQTTDTSLLAGMKVNMGSTEVDLSARGALQRMAQTLQN